MTHEFFRTLEKDHEEVKDILDQLENTSERAVKKKEDLFMKLKQELMPHMKSEEKHFYSILLDKKTARQEAMQAIEEHHVAEMVLKELDKLSKDADNWTAKLKVFKEIVEHHIEEEEAEIFEAAEDSLDENQLEEVMTAFSEEKEKARKKYT
ncbi:MAG: hemerythrin domain-containing protein [Desulfobacteraceae bacterium]|nr:MAG: hemerythrin domain-containing protein [Desulfobacteraceae bacterium]